MKLTFEELKAIIKEAITLVGLDEKDAELLSTIHTESSRDGVYSHGLNRVPRFIEMVEDGSIDISAKPTLVKSMGMAEQYDGNYGMGVKNAIFASNRAIELAREYGFGIATIRNTNHWQRAATYTMNISKNDFIGIAWSNTDGNMPAWGSDRKNIGNNPLSIAIPHEGKDFILDMAMSQYSIGKIQVKASAGEDLEYIGGIDKDGNETKDPKKIQDGGKVYPFGYWKGSGLAIALDILGAILSDGNTTYDVDKLGKGMCVGVNQVFVALDPKKFTSDTRFKEIMNDTIVYIKEGSDDVTYPGERMVKRRKTSLEEGIEVDEEYLGKLKDYIDGKKQ